MYSKWSEKIYAATMVQFEGDEVGCAMSGYVVSCWRPQCKAECAVRLHVRARVATKVMTS